MQYGEASRFILYQLAGTRLVGFGSGFGELFGLHLLWLSAVINLGFIQ